MDFLRGQKTLGEQRPAVAKPKVKSGPKLKKLTLETDLVFVKRDDVIQAQPRLEKKLEKTLTYILCTVEKSSGLCKLDYVTTKEANIVTPLVKEHVKWFAKKFNKNPASFALRSDKGGEFRIAELKKLVPDTANVSSGVSVERKNRQLQANFFRILRNRQASSVIEAVRKSQLMCNETMNKNHNKTPNQLVESKDIDKIIKKYNSTRKSYVAGDKRLPFTVDTWVRILVKKPKASLDYKTYKNMTFSSELYKAKKIKKKNFQSKNFTMRGARAGIILTCQCDRLY